MSKRSTYFDEAQRLYCLGRTLEEIAGILPVSVPSLSRWCADGGWKDKRRAALASSRTAAEALEDLLSQRIETMIANGQFDAKQADECAKISAVIEKMKKGSYNFMAAAVEVMRHFTEYLRRETPDKATIHLFSDKIQDWFRSLE